MTDDELERRIDAFREHVEAGLQDLGTSALVIYAGMGWDGDQPSVLGGECIFTDDANRPPMVRVGERVTLLGYAWSRLEVLKREGAQQCGPAFSRAVQRELQGNVESMEPSQPPGFTTSLQDLARCYSPAVVLGSTLGRSGPEPGVPKRQTEACAALGECSPDEAAAGLGAITRRLGQLVAETAESLGVPLDKFQWMVEAAAGRG